MSGQVFDLNGRLEQLGAARAQLQEPADRLVAELRFATGLARQTEGKTEEWLGLIGTAMDKLEEALNSGRALELGKVVAEAEELLAPIGQEAKTYTIHCCGHGHIDMNWMWSWPETVSVTLDTFETMDRLMDEFPEFHYSQSQISVYKLTQQHHPELWERVKQRVKEGRWEVTAAHWVEGDKNLASGEILCRHLLYSRRWLQENLDMPYEDTKLDWEPDTFGHAWTLPGILNRAGVTRYYHHRAGEGHRLYWWEGKDGSRVLAYDDYPVGYNCDIAPYMGDHLLRFTQETGLRHMMWVFGVGDHGGGPTRNMLRVAQKMKEWPIWPVVKLGTTNDFYEIAEREAPKLDLPVVQKELNFVFRGCYTAETQIKLANRLMENQLVEAEACAVLGGALTGMPYPFQGLFESWERAMFIQFHDILPGSGVRETRQH
ncbi:MAG: alpha-mannosidase, partial [Armatimonadia bacterium]|nr:alpha-mannosidase [Armatimonadia bacterium]